MGLLAVATVAFLISATTSLDKGIKILSNINMVIAVLIMLLVLFAGPTQYILEAFIDSIGAYFSSIFIMSFKLFPFEGLTGWSAGWTLTYLIWWLAWGPFIGIFVARNGYPQFEDVLWMPFFEPLYGESSFRQLLRDLNLPLPAQA